MLHASPIVGGQVDTDPPATSAWSAIDSERILSDPNLSDVFLASFFIPSAYLRA